MPACECSCVCECERKKCIYLNAKAVMDIIKLQSDKHNCVAEPHVYLERISQDVISSLAASFFFVFIHFVLFRSGDVCIFSLGSCRNNKVRAKQYLSWSTLRQFVQ